MHADATSVIRDYFTSALDGAAADHILSLVSVQELCEALVALLRSDDDGAIRDACLVIRDGAMLASTGKRRAFRIGLREHGVIEQLETNLTADNHHTRGHAVYALGKIDSTESVPALRHAFRIHRDTDPLLVPELITECAWLGVDKWELIDSAIDSPIYTTRWSALLNIVESAPDRRTAAKLVARLKRLRQDENMHISDGASYELAACTTNTPGELPAMGQEQRQRELARLKPRLSFGDCANQFSNYLLQSGQSTYTVRELEDFIEALIAAPPDST